MDFINTYPLTLLVEIVAALAATITFKTFRSERTRDFSYLVKYLWLVVLIENLGHFYPEFLCIFKYDERNVFITYPNLLRNYWFYNLYNLVAYSFFFWYFIYQVSTENKLKIVKRIIQVFVLFGLGWLVFSGVLIEHYSKLIDLVGLVMIVVSISFYYFRLLSSNKILSIGKSLPFYISIATLLFFLSMTPLFLSSEYLNYQETVFTSYYRVIISSANYYLYGMFIFGFIRCYWLNKSLSTKSF